MKGTVRNGVIELPLGILLPEGVEVEIRDLPESSADSESSTSSLFEVFQDLVGKAEGLPADYAAEHDHYLYGVPKRTEG